MSALEAALATDTPRRARVRMTLALANAAMAAFICASMFGPAPAALAALAMLVLPYYSLLRRIVSDMVIADKAASLAAAFILTVVAGTIIGGIKVAFSVALVLAPAMLITVCILARADSLVD